MNHSVIYRVFAFRTRRLIENIMARTRPADRIPKLITAAVRVFATKGFRRAQMADIAHEMGVSAGLLYNYVESKEALFYLVVDRSVYLPRERTFGQAPSAQALSFPVRTPPAGAIVRRIGERFRVEAATPALSEALKRPRAIVASVELESVAREVYSSLYKMAHLTAILDQSVHDLPELADMYYGRMRGGLVARLARYIESRVEAGQFRRVPNPVAAARLIIEIATWFARNRRGDPYSRDIDDLTAEETTVDFIVNSLLAQSQGRPKPRKTEKTSGAADRSSEIPRLDQ